MLHMFFSPSENNKLIKTSRKMEIFPLTLCIVLLKELLLFLILRIELNYFN